MSLNTEYQSGTLLSIYQYFEQNSEPFIKGLLRDKGGINYSLSDLQDRKDKVLALMEQLIADYNYTYRTMPLYLYNKKQFSNNRLRCTVVWRVSRKIYRNKDNNMINRLFREDNRHKQLLSMFGPAMLNTLKEYDRCRLVLNTMFSVLNFQHKSVGLFYDACGCADES